MLTVTHPRGKAIAGFNAEPVTMKRAYREMVDVYACPAPVDPLAPARGIMLGLCISALMWLGLAELAYSLWP